jgi:hypothetical protein
MFEVKEPIILINSTTFTKRKILLNKNLNKCKQ